jgi:hypothetical protein
MDDLGDRTGLTPARWRARWVRLSPLCRDLTLVLVVKFAALGMLWLAFFSHPAARPTPLDSPRVGAHVAPAPDSGQAAHADR